MMLPTSWKTRRQRKLKTLKCNGNRQRCPSFSWQHFIIHPSCVIYEAVTNLAPRRAPRVLHPFINKVGWRGRRVPFRA